MKCVLRKVADKSAGQDRMTGVMAGRCTDVIVQTGVRTVFCRSIVRDFSRCRFSNAQDGGAADVAPPQTATKAHAALV
jgi:hypothetical protein